MSILAGQPQTSIEPMLLYMGALGARSRGARWRLRRRNRRTPRSKPWQAKIEATCRRHPRGQRNDIEAARGKGRDAAFIDRLTLDEARVAAMARGLRDIAALPDPVGEVTASWTRPNGLQISRVRVPLGVIGIIYE